MKLKERRSVAEARRSSAPRACRRSPRCTGTALDESATSRPPSWERPTEYIDKRGSITDEMASAKSMENDFVSKKVEKASDISAGSRRTQKFKAADHGEGTQKKQTRAKSRVVLSDDTAPNQSSINKAREKVRVEPVKDGDSMVLPKKDTENITIPKKENDSLGTPKKDIVAPATPKKEILGSGTMKKDIIPPITLKKDVIGTGALKKDGESLGPQKKDVPLSTPSKKDEVIPIKSRKFKIKIASNLMPEKKREDRLNPIKIEEVKSEVTTSEKPDKTKSKDDKLKAERKENGASGKLDEKNREIMNSDVTSSVDEKPAPKMARHHSPATMCCYKYESPWSPGDLAWGRVGQHPFWPCMIAIDHLTGIYTKTKRRGLNAVQQTLHVQFFGDNGRHSWIPTTSVIKYEGKDHFLKFADKVLHEMKKKDKRFTSAFIVKPTSKLKWEAAINEAEETVPKTREDRIQFFQELLPKRKTAEKTDPAPKTTTNGTKSSAQLVKKRNKRPTPSIDENPSKQAKVDRQATVKDSEAKKKNENSVPNTPTRVKRGRNKTMKK